MGSSSRPPIFVLFFCNFWCAFCLFCMSRSSLLSRKSHYINISWIDIVNKRKKKLPHHSSQGAHVILVFVDICIFRSLLAFRVFRLFPSANIYVLFVSYVAIMCARVCCVWFVIYFFFKVYFRRATKNRPYIVYKHTTLRYK